MIKYYKLLVVSILLAFGFSEVVFSQCTSAGTQYPSVTFTPACTGAAETISTCVFAGEYSLINVVAGRIYTFATCGGASYDTQLTLFNNAGLGFLAYNDDGCGAQSTITWTATFTGVVRLKLNLYNCVTNSTCTSVFVTCTVPVGCTYTVPFTGSNTITTGSGTICDHAGTGNYSNSANGYTVINPVGACQSVRLTFTQFTTEGGYDYVTIFDGVGTGGTILYGPTSGSPGLPTITSISGPLTIRFTSDGSVVYAGFSANISNVAAPASTLGSVSNPGPINFCDACGRFWTNRHCYLGLGKQQWCMEQQLADWHKFWHMLFSQKDFQQRWQCRPDSIPREQCRLRSSHFWHDFDRQPMERSSNSASNLCRKLLCECGTTYNYPDSHISHFDQQKRHGCLLQWFLWWNLSWFGYCARQFDNSIGHHHRTNIDDQLFCAL